ncbi:MAG: hypothetical protein ACE5GM_07685 [bacterium]
MFEILKERITMRKLLEGDQLIKHAQELGVDDNCHNHYELQRRVIEAERSIREHKLWIIALISGIASAISAATAIVAVLSK